MSVQIKLGIPFLQKEKQIIALQSSLSSLEKDNTSLQENYLLLQNSFSSLKNEANLLKNELALAKFELISKTEKVSNLEEEKNALILDLTQFKEKNVFLENLNRDLKSQLDHYNLKVNSAADLEDRLNMEVEMGEKELQKLEKLCLGLQEKLTEKENNISILQKSLTQKDKHLSLLLKEKERYINKNPLSEITNQIQNKKRLSFAKGEVGKKYGEEGGRRKEEGGRREGERCMWREKGGKKKEEEEDDNEEEIMRGRRTGEERLEREIERLKKENFELIVRLRNK